MTAPAARSSPSCCMSTTSISSSTTRAGAATRRRSSTSRTAPVGHGPHHLGRGPGDELGIGLNPERGVVRGEGQPEDGHHRRLGDLAVVEPGRAQLAHVRLGGRVGLGRDRRGPAWPGPARGHSTPRSPRRGRSRRRRDPSAPPASSPTRTSRRRPCARPPRPRSQRRPRRARAWSTRPGACGPRRTCSSRPAARPRRGRSSSGSRHRRCWRHSRPPPSHRSLVRSGTSLHHSRVEVTGSRQSYAAVTITERSPGRMRRTSCDRLLGLVGSSPAALVVPWQVFGGSYSVAPPAWAGKAIEEEAHVRITRLLVLSLGVVVCGAGVEHRGRCGSRRGGPPRPRQLPRRHARRGDVCVAARQRRLHARRRAAM